MPNRHRTTLEQWRALQAVVDHGGYQQAADALHRSASSLNHAIAKLQQQLGVPLLQLQGRKAVLTAAGEVLLRRSRQLTDDAHLLESLADNLGIGWEPEVRLAVEPLLPRPMLYRALQQFYPQSRGSRLQVRETIITGTHEAISEGSVDLAICGPLPKGVLGEPIGAVDILPVVHPQHPLAQASAPLTADALSRELQLVIRDSGRKPMENQGWLRAEQRWTLESFEAAIELLQTGIGFCWLPRHRVEPLIRRGALVVLAIREGNLRRIPLHLVVPRPDRLGPCGQLLWQELQQIRLD
ncbi:LysR family transcriptional regulator [Motiliproteus sediminis]|uniref:LysR family transcriptional regulator n=1 Tax=Motiliproteus sediminis TaxID=1468178 RepID=UPI001AEF8F98|nr:LysR family transcriptional regulator [Motiliproteus sediminis]